ncbi:McrC family protein [bacterium]|nr:McrC family protein [bacterium]
MVRKRKSSSTSGLAVSWHARERPLLVLSDQGAARPLPRDFFSMAGRDRSWNPHAENFINANRVNLAALEVTTEWTPDVAEISLRLKPGGVVGAVPLYAPDTRKIAGGVVIRPRFGWDDIGPLLHHIGWSASPRILNLPLVPGSAREVPPWVLAGPVLRRLSKLIREVRCGFRLHEEVRQSPRGQIVWSRYVAQQAVRGAFHELPCRFPELGPDLILQGFLRWGVERVRIALTPFSAGDAIARHLVHEAENLLFELRHAKTRVPDQHSLRNLLRIEGLPSEVLRSGLQALGWLVDERGLAGTTENDSLAWCLPMHQLFERWVEAITRAWARGFGGQVQSANSGETTVPIVWDRRSLNSLGSLIPDLIVRTGEQMLIIDSKYKGHFEELDDHRWHELREELRSEHRHDLHQILAYAALYEANHITSMLVYPMQPSAWDRLARRRQTIITANLRHGGRNLTLALACIPLKLPIDSNPEDITTNWDSLRTID